MLFNLLLSGVPAGQSACAFIARSVLCPALACALAVPAFAADTLPPAADGATVWIRMPQGDVVPFNGAYNYDTTTKNGQSMTYMMPAGNFIAGLVAAAATHGAMANAANESKKRELRDTADKVLLPYADILKNYRLAELLGGALPQMKSPGDKKLIANATDSAPEGAEAVEMTPAFFMTQDQRSLVLENSVLVKQGKNAEPKPVAVRIVSSASVAKDPVAYWKDGDGLKLKEVSARLLSDSLDIALANVHGRLPADSPYKTVRYLEGGAERFERGQPLVLECNQLLMRNLRGGLMSIPVKPGSLAMASASACPDMPIEEKMEAKLETPESPVQPAAGM
jgi:hypothetical protein